MEHLQKKMEEKRAKDAVEQKALDKAQEIARRESGQKQVETQLDAATAQRKRDADARKREKNDFKRERERLRKQIADDKAERMANKVGQGGDGGVVWCMVCVLCCGVCRVVSCSMYSVGLGRC